MALRASATLLSILRVLHQSSCNITIYVCEQRSNSIVLKQSKLIYEVNSARPPYPTDKYGFYNGLRELRILYEG